MSNSKEDIGIYRSVIDGKQNHAITKLELVNLISEIALKLKNAIEILGADGAIRIAENVAKEININWNEGACFVFSAITDDIERAPAKLT